LGSYVIGPKQNAQQPSREGSITGGITNGNEEESYQEGRQEEKEVTDSGEALCLADFLLTPGLRTLFAEAFCRAPAIGPTGGGPSS
jgi:hypothetical protein